MNVKKKQTNINEKPNLLELIDQQTNSKGVYIISVFQKEIHHLQSKNDKIALFLDVEVKQN